MFGCRRNQHHATVGLRARINQTRVIPPPQCLAPTGTGLIR